MDLSIIIPIYNTREFLRDCLDSIVKEQDFSEINYEIIIIDDGSTDDSSEIVFNYRKYYTNITYKYFSNHGQGFARNQGINMAKGKYIYFMDSDDKLARKQLSNVIKNIHKDDFDMVLFDGKSFTDLENIDLINYSRSKEYGIYNSGQLLYADLYENKDLTVSPCLYVIKRDILEKNRIRFPENHKYEDEVFYVHVIFSVNKVKHLNQTVFLRRIRNNSTMTSQTFNSKFVNYAYTFLNLLKVIDEIEIKYEYAYIALIKNVRHIYTTAITNYHNSEKKLSSVKLYNDLVRAADEYNFFDYKGYLATKYYAIYKLLFKIKYRRN